MQGRLAFGRSDLLSREMADKVRTAVTPKVILSLVASLSEVIKTVTIMFPLLLLFYHRFKKIIMENNLFKPIKPKSHPA